jgi:hypothetical protein
MGLAVGVAIAFVGAVLFLRARDRAEALQPEVVVTPVIAVGADALPAPPPGQVQVGLPLRGPVVAHVWLENCADCMTAFSAFREVREANALYGVPQVNVAYGHSTPEFAARYRVDENLIVDVDGAQVVKPFGIGSFTTLVLDKSGAIIHRDRPDHAGYVERVKEAWARAAQ